MEKEILTKLNSVARDYTSSRNLIKNINKRFKDEFVILSCEPSGANYKVVKVSTPDNNNYKYKLVETDNRVEFILFSDKINVTATEIFDILMTGNIKITRDTITIVLDDLTAEDMEIMLKGLGRR